MPPHRLDIEKFILDIEGAVLQQNVQVIGASSRNGP
jgi:hypothetical protein